jgi:uncharacterized membrane protein YidH (DUF202 family)
MDLVELLPPPNPRDPEVDVNSRPDLAPGRFFLAWFVPMSVYLILFFGMWMRPMLIQNLYLAVFLVCLSFAANIGAFWMIYQAIRHERRVGRYVLLAFIPFMFVWYSLVRVPLHKKFQSKSDFIR